MTRSVYDKCIKPFALDGMWEQFAESQVAYEIELTRKLIDSAIIEIKKQYMKANKKPDWFYSVEVRGWKFFVAMNEMGKFTIMFPEDY